MYVSKEFKFEAAHMLPRHNGKCRNEHGHSWRVIVEVGGDINKETQFVMDYAELKKLVQPIIDRFDHQHLNAFVRYPSSENIAIHIAHLLRPHFGTDKDNGYYFVVKVSETQSSWAAWDSRVQKCLDIFDKFSLDTPAADDQPPNLDAEWRSPDAGAAFDVPREIQHLEGVAATLLEDWIDANSRLQQLKLYRDSLTPAPFGGLRQESANKEALDALLKEANKQEE